jgi:hypothetical protein
LLFLYACSPPTDSAPPSYDLPPYECKTEPSIECTTMEELSLDATSRFGFSANDVLPLLVGNYEIPIAWVSPCAGGTTCFATADCSRFDEQPPVSFAGTRTMLRVRLAASDRAPVVRLCRSQAHSLCEVMMVPSI